MNAGSRDEMEEDKMAEQDQSGFMNEQNDNQDEESVIHPGGDETTESDPSVSGADSHEGQYKRIEGLPGAGDDEPQTRGSSDE